MKEKCPKEDYSEDDVKKFEKYIEKIDGFQAEVWETDRRMREEHIEKMKYMTESEIEEYIERLADSEQERKAFRKDLKF